jgi:hypothetical protein
MFVSHLPSWTRRQVGRTRTRPNRSRPQGRKKTG